MSRMRSRRWIALTAFLVGCAAPRPSPPSVSTPPRVPPELVARVAALRAEAKGLLSRQAELFWRNWVYGDPVDVAATYQGHEALFGREAIEAVERLRALSGDPEERRALGYLRLYLVGEAVGRAVAPLSEQIASLEEEATFVTPAGVEQPYRELDRLLAGEVSYALRGRISDAALPVVRKLGPVLAEKARASREALAGLGFSGPAEFAAELRQLDPAALASLANRLLDGTEELYRTAMNAAARSELGIGLGGMRLADLPRFDRTPPLDAWFPAEKAMPVLRATWAGMGLDLARQGNLRIDDAPLPKKNPTAVCFPVAVPGDVRLSVKPRGGIADCEALLHESGHAEHWAHTKVEPFELQILGDGTVGEAYALLAEGLAENPVWLAEKVGLSGDRAAAFVRGAAVRRLFLLRRHAGEVLFQVGLAAGTANPRELYRASFARAYGFPLSPADAERWQVERDDFLGAADAFRAAFLAAQIEAWLAKRFGPAWWDAPGAGEALAGLWQSGDALGPDEIARRLDEPGVRPEPLLAKLRGELAR